MWLFHATQNEAVRALAGGQVRPAHVESLAGVPASGVSLLWRSPPEKWPALPDAAIVEETQQTEFLAWAVTYLKNWRPFTSFCRVTDRQTFDRLLNPSGESRFDSRALGLILGEAMMRAPRRQLMESCWGTYSFAMAKAQVVGGDIMLRRVNDRWLGIMNLLRRPFDGESYLVLALLWSMSPDLGAKAFGTREWSVVIGAVNELVETHRLGKETLKQLTGSDTRLDAFVDAMSGTREQRVIAFDKAVAIVASTCGPLVGGMLCGYLANSLNPGSLEYAPLLATVSSKFPAAPIWYGFCAGLNFDLGLLDFANGAGWRIVREIRREENPLDSPRCDISAPELRLRASGSNGPFDASRFIDGIGSVEIDACVTTQLEVVETVEAQSELFRTPEVSEVLDELDTAVARVQSLKNKLRATLNPKQSNGARRAKRR